MPITPTLHVNSTTDIGNPITLRDFEQGSRQRIDAWFNKANNSLYGTSWSASGVFSKSVPSGTTTAVTFDNVQYQTQNCFSSSAVTVDRPGLYQNNVTVTFSSSFSAGDVIYLRIKSGLLIMATIPHYCFAGEQPTVTMSIAVLMDEIAPYQITIDQSTGSTHTISSQSWSGFFVRPI